VSSNTTVSLTFQNLEQFKNIAFPSGKTDEWISHRAFGAGARFIIDSRFIKYLELQGYQIDAQSQDLADTEFTVDSAKIFQILSDSRKLAGSVTNGAK
jgi:hypothetical protein